MDDEMRWRDFIADILSSAGFAVDTVATRREAAEMLASRLYHLLVLDIRMQSDDPTNEDGMDLLRDLHRSDLGAAFAVILCSGYGSFAQMREASFVLHAADFLDKGSFHEELFLERVRELFSQILKIQLGLRIPLAGRTDGP